MSGIFGGLKALNDLRKNSGNMMKQMEEFQNKLSALRVDGVSSCNRVTVTIDGLFTVQNVNIDESLLKPSEKQNIEKAIVSAYASARKNIDPIMLQSMSGMGEMLQGMGAGNMLK